MVMARHAIISRLTVTTALYRFSSFSVAAPVDAVDKADSKDVGDVAGDPRSSHTLGSGSGGTRMAESLSCRALSIFRRLLLRRRIFLVEDQGHTIA